MLAPKKLKYSKQQKGRRRNRGIARRGTELAFGSFGLKALTSKWITDRQIEACRLSIVRTLKRKGRLWIRIFPHKPVTSKGTEFGMGGGKGKLSHYVYPISPGRILFELEGIDEQKAREAFGKAADKLPIKTKFISR